MGTSSNLWDVLTPIQSGPLYSKLCWGYPQESGLRGISRSTVGTGIFLHWDFCLLGNWPYSKMYISVSCSPTVQTCLRCKSYAYVKGQWKDTRVVTWGTLWAIHSGWGQELRIQGHLPLAWIPLWAAWLPSQMSTNSQPCPQAGAQGWSGVLTDLEPENSEMIRTACDSFGSGVWGPSQTGSICSQDAENNIN